MAADAEWFAMEGGYHGGSGTSGGTDDSNLSGYCGWGPRDAAGAAPRHPFAEGSEAVAQSLGSGEGEGAVGTAIPRGCDGKAAVSVPAVSVEGDVPWWSVGGHRVLAAYTLVRPLADDAGTATGGSVTHVTPPDSGLVSVSCRVISPTTATMGFRACDKSGWDPVRCGHAAGGNIGEAQGGVRQDTAGKIVVWGEVSLQLRAAATAQGHRGGDAAGPRLGWSWAGQGEELGAGAEQRAQLLDALEHLHVCYHVAPNESDSTEGAAMIPGGRREDGAAAATADVNGVRRVVHGDGSTQQPGTTAGSGPRGDAARFSAAFRRRMSGCVAAVDFAHLWGYPRYAESCGGQFARASLLSVAAARPDAGMGATATVRVCLPLYGWTLGTHLLELWAVPASAATQRFVLRAGPRATYDEDGEQGADMAGGSLLRALATLEAGGHAASGCGGIAGGCWQRGWAFAADSRLARASVRLHVHATSSYALGGALRRGNPHDAARGAGAGRAAGLRAVYSSEGEDRELASRYFYYRGANRRLHPPPGPAKEGGVEQAMLEHAFMRRGTFVELACGVCGGTVRLGGRVAE